MYILFLINVLLLLTGPGLHCVMFINYVRSMLDSIPLYHSDIEYTK
jgi:hypothetical protein